MLNMLSLKHHNILLFETRQASLFANSNGVLQYQEFSVHLATIFSILLYIRRFYIIIPTAAFFTYFWNNIFNGTTAGNRIPTGSNILRDTTSSADF